MPLDNKLSTKYQLAKEKSPRFIIKIGMAGTASEGDGPGLFMGYICREDEKSSDREFNGFWHHCSDEYIGKYWEFRDNPTSYFELYFTDPKLEEILKLSGDAYYAEIFFSTKTIKQFMEDDHKLLSSLFNGSSILSDMKLIKTKILKNEIMNQGEQGEQGGFNFHDL